MTKGIIIIATKHFIYGRMAYNLALTIKATGTNIPVTLIHDAAARRHLSDEHLKMFDETIITDWNWNKIRFNVDKLSSYDLTMQLDADMLWLWKDPDLLFEAHKDAELLVTNEGYYDIETKEEKLTGNYVWLAELEDTIKLYKLKGKLYQMRWEVLMFKKTEAVRKMLSKAEAIRKNPKLQTWLFEGQPVDEFAFYVASNILGLDQQASPWVPAYWCQAIHNPTVAEMNKRFHAVGFGGNAVSDGFKTIYNIIMQVACKKLGLRYLFPLQSKRDYIQDRIKV